MAEGLTNYLRADYIEAYSAGTKPKSLDPLAVEVMNEIRIDISKHLSKMVDELKGISFDFVVTVCGDADENCPTFSDLTKVIHVGFDDPAKLALSTKTKEEALSHYRRVRDEIKKFTQTIPESLLKKQ